jgi:saccharopine dehydrogenase-like NADP-dependent oxidoreductase
MMVEPLIDFLLKNSDNSITIAANEPHLVKSVIEKRKNSKINGDTVDVVKETDKLNQLVKDHDLIISYVPPFLHEYVAKSCLENKRNMLTTSYVGEYMKKMKEEIKKNDLIFMNEIGLDPGIDHIITHKVINEAEKNGDKILSYQSWCGALVSPEFLNNPLMYKFSWSPKGALIALRNDAKQLIDGRNITIPTNKLLMTTIDKKFHSCFNFEGYFNRDSLHYKKHYNLKDAHTCIRGTIRYQGFAFIFQCFKNLGMFGDDKIDTDKLNSWNDYFNNMLIDKKDIITNMKKKYVKDNMEIYIKATSQLVNKTDKSYYFDLSLLALSKFEEIYIKKHGFENLIGKIFAALSYLSLFDKNNKVIYDININYLD